MHPSTVKKIKDEIEICSHHIAMYKAGAEAIGARPTYVTYCKESAACYIGRKEALQQVLTWELHETI